MADEPEADCAENRSGQAARERVQYLCNKHHAEHRPPCQQESAAADGSYGKRCEQPFRGNAVDQSTDRNLQRHGGECPDRQDQADVELRPTLGCQIGGDKRSPSGLDVSEKEGKPVEPALAPALARRRGMIGFGGQGGRLILLTYARLVMPGCGFAVHCKVSFCSPPRPPEPDLIRKHGVGRVLFRLQASAARFIQHRACS